MIWDWNETMCKNHSFPSLADELEGIFDERVHFNSTMGQMQACTYCVKHEECHQTPNRIPPKRDVFFFVLRCDCPSSYFGEDDGCGRPSSPHWSLSLSRVPRQTHVNLSSHLREAQALGVIMTYRRLPTGRGWGRNTRTHTHTRTHTRCVHIDTHNNVPSTPLFLWS